MSKRIMVIIEDTEHSCWLGRFASPAAAIEELRRLVTLPWDAEPNRAPCKQWRTCGRVYGLIEFDDAVPPTKRLRSIAVLSINAKEVKWLVDPAEGIWGISITEPYGIVTQVENFD